MGQLDTYQVLVIAYLTFNLPLSIWLMRSFFLNLPIDIEEAAMIDGCSYFSTFIRIALPLVKNGIFATGILTFMFSWNEFLFALILTSSVKAQTLPINIAGYVSFHKLNFGAMAAISIVALIPIFAIFYYIQKYIVTGMTMGAVKG
jgi:multiple sugar transport system permease protein